MSRKNSDNTKQLVQELYTKGMPIVEIAERTSIACSTIYGYVKAKQLGLPYSGYNEYLAQQRQNRPENRELGLLIKSRLVELEQNQSWLANEIGVTKQAVSLYIKGKAFPSEAILRKLSSSLNAQHALDGLLLKCH